VYPALAVHSALMAKVPALDTLWVGGEGGMEESLVKRLGIQFKAIPAAGVHGVGIAALPRNVVTITRGTFAARRILSDFKPDVMFFTGGYVAVPMALAGRSLPSVLYVPDIEPGMALKYLAGRADVIAVTTTESQKFFNKKVYETGYPVRKDLALWDRQTAFQHFGIADGSSVLLVFGGSKGAHSLNAAVVSNLPALLERFHMVHISGEQDWDLVQQARAQLTADSVARYHAMPYLHEMGAALAAADLVVSRAGASTLGEYPLFGLPAVLVPYPHAWRYQKVNADYLSRRGAAITLMNERLNEELLPTLSVLMDNPNKLKAMRAAMFQLSHPRAAEKIASALIDLVGA
jgi:UDP-N-acetylglucosamine--N-acetylmuramyl-(pentapeptide) pyrophosphoryl-undecaprenol N-acetylglucosamine transferase